MSSMRTGRAPGDASRILFVRNLPYKINNTELYDIFGKYGAIKQIRLGNAPDTKGTAYVVYEDVREAKAAVDHLSGFNVAGRYLVCGYFRPARGDAKKDENMKDE